MKTYKEIISEVAEPIGDDEKRFKAKHVIQKINHPAAEDGQFTGGKTAKKDKSKIASYKNGEDKEVYEAHKIDMQERYGDKWKSVMYATATKRAVEEAVNLDEISVKKLDRYVASNEKDREDLSMNKIGWVKGSPTADQQKSIDKLKKRVKGSELAGQKTYPNVYKNTPYAAKVAATNEAFNPGAMKLADGTNAKLTNEEASALNTLFKELTSVNQKKMQERMMKDKKGFSEIVSFAKEAL